jgi:ribosome biogenesis protein YTM1
VQQRRTTMSSTTNSSTTTSTTSTTSSTSTRKPNKDGKVLVRFVTKNPKIRVPDTPMAVPAKLGRFGLSEVINLLLNNEKPQPFDFLINTEFIRTSIEKHIRKHNVKEEQFIVVEYTEAVVPPERELECEHDDWVSSLAGGFSGFVVTGSYDKKVRVWDQETGACLATVDAHESAVKTVSWIAKTTKRKDDKAVYKLASGGLDRLVKTWRVTEKGSRLKHVFRGHVGSVNSVHVNPTGTRLCSGSFDHTVKMWFLKPENLEEPVGNNIAKKRKLAEGPLEVLESITLVGHTASVSCVQWPTATQLVSASWDHTIKVWDADTASEQHTLYNNTVVNYASYSTLHSLIASSHADTSIRVWDPRVGESKQAQFTLNSHSSWGSGVSWHPFSPHAQLASSSHDGTVKVWDLRSELPLFTVTTHKDKVLCVDWAGVGVGEEGVNRFDLASGGADNKMRVFKCDSLQHT